MNTNPFGQTGANVSVIGQGTWYLDHGDRKRAIAALQRGLDLGMTHVDTAEMYGDAELVIGDAIASRRDEVFLVSKVLPSNASRRGNFDVDDLGEILDVAGEGRIACNQVLYHLKERAIEHAVIPWCEKHGVAVVAYSPFGHDDFPADNSRGGAVLGRIAQARRATPRQVTLSFLTRAATVFAIPKASSAEHAGENAAAGDLVLTQEEITALDAAFPRGPKPRGLPML
jgi:diketogulonate reductase-like aldo/keto reductase